MFDGLDYQYPPEEHLHLIDADPIFTNREQPLDPAAYNKWHNWEVAYMQCSLSRIALTFFTTS